jgi:flagellar secretion chaperone FliS
MGASPVQLIVMLYDGAIRFMEEGKRAMAEKDYETQNARLQRAQKIVMELMGSLDFAQGGDVAKNLLKLYEYVLAELIEANINDDPKRIENAQGTMRELREAWATIQSQGAKVAA